MEELWQQVSSPFWWFSAIIVGILVNLASDYLRPAIDKELSKYSESRRQASEKRQKEFEDEVERLLADKSGTEIIRLELNQLRTLIFVFANGSIMLLAIIGFLILAYFGDFVSDHPSVLISLVPLFVLLVTGVIASSSFLSSREYSDTKMILKEVDKQKREQVESSTE